MVELFIAFKLARKPKVKERNMGVEKGKTEKKDSRVNKTNKTPSIYK